MDDWPFTRKVTVRATEGDRRKFEGDVPNKNRGRTFEDCPKFYSIWCLNWSQMVFYSDSQARSPLTTHLTI